MVEHWVAEVFPPKFQFESVEEMLENPELEDAKSQKTNFYGEMYRKVYCEEEGVCQSRKQRSELAQSIEITDNKHTVSSVKVDAKRKIQKRLEREDKSDSLWGESELKMLRRFLQKAKMQNLELAAILESTQDEIKLWKEKYQKLHETEKIEKNAFFCQKKKYEKLKVNYRAVKDDVRRYHANLKITREDYEELKNEKKEVEQLLSETKSELHKEKLKNEVLQGRLKGQKREFEENKKYVEYFLEQQYQLEKGQLQKEIDILREKLEKEKRENDVNKKALQHLRSHFSCLLMKQDNAGGTTAVEKVLSVIDIDYIPM
ncbi:hypothetical protein P5673_001513 [Acropora cervicornis]|uniref:Uncharacterized protein n=1 Tax=Acropora cervicornis TaxID=6130 RepID=A0AAD9VH84_ACRCE|nr:hypothetical protein P5673_001513 [Acropora cervicornis]